jgi:hypothetical protein
MPDGRTDRHEEPNSCCALFHASAAVWMRHSLYWGVAQRRWIVIDRCFEAAYLCDIQASSILNPLNAQLNPNCHLLALLGAHSIVHVSRIRVKTDVFGLRHCVNFLSPRLSSFMICTPEMVLRDDKIRNKWWTGYTANVGKKRRDVLRRFAASYCRTCDTGCCLLPLLCLIPPSPVTLRVATSDNQSVCSLWLSKVLLNLRLVLGILDCVLAWVDCGGVCARDCAVLIFHLQFVVFCFSSSWKHQCSVLLCVFWIYIGACSWCQVGHLQSCNCVTFVLTNSE